MARTVGSRKYSTFSSRVLIANICSYTLIAHVCLFFFNFFLFLFSFSYLFFFFVLFFFCCCTPCHLWRTTVLSALQTHVYCMYMQQRNIFSNVSCLMSFMISLFLYLSFSFSLSYKINFSKISTVSEVFLVYYFLRSQLTSVSSFFECVNFT